MKYISGIFLKEGITEREASPMEGVDYHTLASGLQYIEELSQKGITNFLVFGSTQNKSVEYACSQGLIKEFIKSAKETFGDDITLFADVGLSPYSEDGHSTVIENGEINLEKSYELASKLALAFAEAGADYIAPCLSLSEQVKYMREALDQKGFQSTKIMAYSAKFSSALYGPYRATVQSPIKGKDKKFYQTDYSDDEKALNQIKKDEEQKADIVIVKPAMFYLDIVYRARQLTKLPLAVYHISGEYTMIKDACKSGVLDENETFDEVHSAFKRCHVDYVIGYAPEHFARWSSKTGQ